MVVAVPARDEAGCIRECIRSIDEAAAEVSVPVLVVVAADACSDDTADVARSTATEFCDLAVIEGTWGRAGASRAAAVRHALERRPIKSGRVWIANTDADCLVPRSWLRTQVELATESDAVAGIVELDPLSTAPAMFDAFTASYILDGDKHGHVHGANIGLSDDAYLAVGGWCRKTVVGEDHVLWNSLRSLGHRLQQTTTLRVVTSARTRSRVLGGFATNLDNLDARRPLLVPANV
jgi:glycosyltransferase involved in cell wall biosynthesis